MLIATITPNCAYIPFEWVKCILALPQRYSYYAVEGPSLPDNRNRVFDYAKRQADDLLFIDSDIVFTPEDVAKIENYLKNGYDAVTGVYVLGRPPYNPALFKRIAGDYELTLPMSGLNEIGACGGGFLGISKKVIAALPDNPFSNLWEGPVQHGEDVSFCHRLHNAGFKLWCDSSINVGQVRMFKKFYGKSDFI